MQHYSFIGRSPNSHSKTFYYNTLPLGLIEVNICLTLGKHYIIGGKQ